MMNLSYIKLLKNRNFVIYLISQMISVFSDAVFKISLMWYLVSYENSLSSIAEVLFVSYLPNILVALFGGYFVDVCNRKKIMIGCDFFSACALVVFYFVISTQTLNMIFILLIRFFLSLMDVFYAPASSSLLLKMVSDDELVSAKLLFNTVYSSLNIISAGLGSIMLAMIGLKNVSLFNALAYLLASVCILLINVDGKVEHNKIEAFSFFECIRGFYEIIHDHFLVQFTSVILYF